MKQTDYSRLCDVARGEFAIRDGCLFYNNRQVASGGKLILASAEEAFFMFKVEDAETGKLFKEVFFLNSPYPHFYQSIESHVESTRFQFISSRRSKNAFRLISYGGYSNTKIVGDNYYENGRSPLWTL